MDSVDRMNEIEKLVEGIALPPTELWASSLFYKCGFDDGDLVERWVNDVYEISHHRKRWEPTHDGADRHHRKVQISN